jgi:hypothetical protein
MPTKTTPKQTTVQKKYVPVKKTKQVKKNDNYLESDNNYSESGENNEFTGLVVPDLEQLEESSNLIDIDKKLVKKDNNEDKKKSFIKNDFLEKIIKYVKIDNLIRKETVEYKERVNTLKEDKQELENYILRYLEDKKEDIVFIEGSGKLTKYESIRKSGLNKDIIKQSICDQIKKEKLMTDDNKIKELAELTYEVMENKREKKVKTTLKRTFNKEKKEKPAKATKANKEKKANSKKVVDGDVDEKPKKVQKPKGNK